MLHLIIAHAFHSEKAKTSGHFLSRAMKSLDPYVASEET